MIEIGKKQKLIVAKTVDFGTGGDPDKDNGDELLGNHRTFIAVQVQEGNSRGHKGEAQERCGCHRCT